MEPYSRTRSLIVLLVTAVVALLLSSARGATAAQAYEVIGIKTKDVLSGTSLTAKVMPGESRQLVCMTTYLTGKTDKTAAVNVRLDVFEEIGKRLVTKYSRDFGAERNGNVGRGDVQLVDLDNDGINEIIVHFETYDDPLIDQQLGEVIFHDDSGFRAAWTGPMKYDATRAARGVPQERRDRYRREVDLVGTLRTRGATLYFNKTMIAVAGQRLDAPKVVQESFPLKPRTNW